MTAEELLKPRIFVQHTYPNAPFKTGEIITEPTDEQLKWVDEFNLLFRKLYWWENRKESEMPKFIKFQDGSIGEMTEHIKIHLLKDTAYIRSIGIMPATKEEFEKYSAK